MWSQFITRAAYGIYVGFQFPTGENKEIKTFFEGLYTADRQIDRIQIEILLGFISVVFSFIERNYSSICVHAKFQPISATHFTAGNPLQTTDSITSQL